MSQSVPEVGQWVFHSKTETLMPVLSRYRSQGVIKLCSAASLDDSNWLPWGECEHANPVKIVKLESYELMMLGERFSVTRVGSTATIQQQDGRTASIQLPHKEADILSIACQGLAKTLHGRVSEPE